MQPAFCTARSTAAKLAIGLALVIFVATGNGWSQEGQSRRRPDPAQGPPGEALEQPAGPEQPATQASTPAPPTGAAAPAAQTVPTAPDETSSADSDSAHGSDADPAMDSVRAMMEMSMEDLLDQVVLTGTVIGTERGSLGNSIGVLDGEQLQPFGALHIDADKLAKEVRPSGAPRSPAISSDTIGIVGARSRRTASRISLASRRSIWAPVNAL